MNGEDVDKIQRLTTSEILGFFESNKLFTGQLNIEIHCKNGVLKDIFLSSRRKVKKGAKND